MKTKNNLAIAIIIIIISITSVYPSNKVTQNNPIKENTVFNHQEKKLNNMITLSSKNKINESLFEKTYIKDLKKSTSIAINRRIQ